MGHSKRTEGGLYDLGIVPGLLQKVSELPQDAARQVRLALPPFLFKPEHIDLHFGLQDEISFDQRF